MPRRYAVRRSLSALVAVAAVTGATAAVGDAAPAHAGPTPYAVPGTATVVFVLHPSDPARLRRLAADRAASAPARLAALRAAAPSAATRDRAARWLASHGFAVTAATPWTVSATAPATTAAAALGVTAVRANGYLTHRGALRAPAALAGLVDGVVGFDDRPVFRHETLVPRPDGTLGGDELRDAYGMAAGAIGTGATIATVQLSGWNRYDLKNYATAAGITDAAAGALTPYADTSQRAAAYDGTTDGDGDFEVALDQESLLATAPGAAQRMYFAANTTGGFELALTKVLTDVWGGVPVTALSVSWGACEQDLAPGGDTSQLTAMEQTLENLVAAGVTVFAASGDTGAYDCAQTLADGTPNPAADQRGVDFPGSSPAVVSVGGTRLVHTASGWHETAWGPTWPAPGRVFGSGGGFSTTFARPAWQVGIGGQFTSMMRGVPDIASAADPVAGFAVYEKRLCGVSGWCLGGGTSAGAPAQAGLFVDALVASGRTTGIGDVHAVLYGAPGGFHDLTEGSNGTDPAGAGWDPVTGLGSPRWDVLGPRLQAIALVAPFAVPAASVPVYASAPSGTTVSAWTAQEGAASPCSATGSPTAPSTVPLADSGDRATAVAVGALTSTAQCLGATARVRVDSVAPTAAGGLRSYDDRDGRAVLSWRAASDGPAPSWAGRFDVRIRRYRDGRVVQSGPRGMGGAQTLTLAQGAAYRAEVRATDRAGNVGAWVTTPYLLVPYDGAHFAYGTGWSHTASSSAYGGHIAYATKKWSSTTARFTGSKLWLEALTTPGSGRVWVNVDGHYVRTLNLYSSASQWHHLLLAWSGATGSHTVKFTNAGSHVAASSGTFTWIDAIAVQ